MMEAPTKLFRQFQSQIATSYQVTVYAISILMISRDTEFHLMMEAPRKFFQFQSQIATLHQLVTVYAIWIVMIPPDTELHSMMEAPTTLFVNYKFRFQLHIQSLDAIWMYSTISRFSGNRLGLSVCSIGLLAANAARNRQLSLTIG